MVRDICTAKDGSIMVIAEMIAGGCVSIGTYLVGVHCCCHCYTHCCTIVILLDERHHEGCF